MYVCHIGTKDLQQLTTSLDDSSLLSCPDTQLLGTIELRVWRAKFVRMDDVPRE